MRYRSGRRRLRAFDEAGFKESEHPRGNPENAGQFTSTGGGGGSKSEPEPSKSQSKKEQPDFRGSLARPENGPSIQPVESLDELYEKAKQTEPEFKNIIKTIADKYNSEPMYTPEQYAEPGTILKSRKSAERKLTSELGGDPKLLRDVIRATVVSHSVEDTRKAAADFIGEHADSIVRVKDRYTDTLAGGYRDILINYRMPNGLVAEIQFNSKNMVKAKNEEAHSLYEKARELVSPTVEALKNLEEAMAAIYERAFKADGNSDYKKAPRAQDAIEQTEATDKVLRRYRLSQAGGDSFEAIITQSDGKLEVATNRNGKWEPDPELSFADLVMPEQSLGDTWDVTPLPPGDLPGGPDDPTKQRATDRRPITADANDIMYFTSESLGPNRDRTPEGFLICYDVPVARIGEMTYGPGEVPMDLGVSGDGRIRVTRSAAEVFDRNSMASLNGKPVTDDHPPVDVDPKNWAYYMKGVVVNPRRGEGDLEDFLLANLIIYDEEMIRDIEAGKREVSCGYNPDYYQVLDKDTMQPIPGRGEQVHIRYNHLALVKAGRCGPNCAIGDRRTVDENLIDTFFTPERARRFRRLLKRFE